MPEPLRGLLLQCARVPYEYAYALALRRHDRPARAVSELFLFRLWLTWRACTRGGSSGSDSIDAERVSLPALLEPALREFEEARRIRVAVELGDAWEALVRARFALYDHHHAKLRQRSPVREDFSMAAMALAHQLHAAPNSVVSEQLAFSASLHYQSLLRLALAEPSGL